ncbi:MAG: D-2-hydroxyacid dehydrogenase [Lachnospiraceae bacterium]
MKIVFLDAKTIGDDIDLSAYHKLGEVVCYDFSSPQQVPLRVVDADVIVVNKMQINANTIHTATQLKLVCVTATGTNNLDKTYLDSRQIAWRNVAGYSTESVAQHTFAMLFYLLEKLRYYDDYVKEERYVDDTVFTHFEERFHELHAMTWGIIGLGNIGRRVADIAHCFGASIQYYSTSGSHVEEKYHPVSLEKLLSTSDIISVHAPLTPQTQGLLNANAFAQMKPCCIFLNLGRGPIVDEQALTDALLHHTISAAGLDVLSEEPMRQDNPLLALKDSRRLLITPHIAWASIESRTRLMKIILQQIQDFFSYSS